MSKTLTPRQRERRARILRTARELINEAGYAGMTTRELAARAKVSATTLFNLYNTKEDVDRLIEGLALVGGIFA